MQQVLAIFRNGSAAIYNEGEIPALHMDQAVQIITGENLKIVKNRNFASGLETMESRLED